MNLAEEFIIPRITLHQGSGPHPGPKNPPASENRPGVGAQSIVEEMSRQKEGLEFVKSNGTCSTTQEIDI